MESMVGKKPAVVWALNISVVALVLLWLFPTMGLFVSSFRTADQISGSGWWQSMFATEQNSTLRTTDPDDEGVQQLSDGLYVIEGNLFGDGGEAEISVWGTSSRAIADYVRGKTITDGFKNAPKAQTIIGIRPFNA